jgi:signal transduction histidine kinase
MPSDGNSHEQWITPGRVLGAILAVAGALGLTLLVRPWIPNTQFVFFYAAILVAAVLGGVPLSVFALAAALLLTELFLYDAPGALELSGAMLLRNLPLVLVSATVIMMLDRHRQARRAAERKTREAEALTERLSEQATQLEHQVMESETLAADLEEAGLQLREQADAARRAAVKSDKLQRLTGLLLEAVGEPAVARVITHEARAAVDAAGAAVAVVRERGQLDLASVEGIDATALQTVAGAGAPSLFADSLASGEPLWLTDAAAPPQRYPELASLSAEHRAWCALPLRVERHQLGVVVFSFAQPGEFAQEDRSFLLLLAQQCAQALERARLHDTSLRARVRAEFAERRLELLAEASVRLTASLDYEAALGSMAELLVPDLADWCAVHLHDDQESSRLVSLVHVDRDRAARRRLLESRRRNGGVALTGFEAVVRQGRTHYVEPITDELLRAVAGGDEQLEILRSFQLQSQLTVGIGTEGALRGTMTLGSAESGRVFGEADIRLAVELGRRAGQAVDNARLYQNTHFASEAKSNFLAVMSHELRTPLNAIIGYSDLLLLGVPSQIPDPARRQIERVRSASDSLLHLVEEVLSFSRIEAGKEEIRISPMDLSVLLTNAVAMIEPLAAEKQLSVELRLPGYPLKLVSDERKIRQIVTNLLSNAVKFTERGELRVDAVQTDGEIRVTFSDTGIGIPQEHLEHIFDPFWQVEQPSTRRFGGTGLGLGVARKLTRLLEGRLEVESEEGKGSVFTLTLPRHTPGTGRGG